MRTIVVGAGAAGLWCALHAAERGPVWLIAPVAQELAATSWARGGIAAAIGVGDGPRLHAADTVAAGAGLCDHDAVRVLVGEAPEAVTELAAMGVRFDGPPRLEGGHGMPRVLHAGDDATGHFLHGRLLERVEAESRIHRVVGLVVRLLKADIAIGEERGSEVDAPVVGVVLEDGNELRGDRVVLATGGATGLYARRTGPGSSIGSGLALAWRAGAALADLEFVQFHPTALDVPTHPPHLLTEALRGEGAVLVDADGQRFMHRFHERAELAPRDVVARAVVQVRQETTRPVFLDARHVPDLHRRFPVAAEQCSAVGLDISTRPIPIAPAAHYFVGGILTDSWGRTTVPGLLACGEAAATGVHGANRLGSNSLIEAIVFGRRAARSEPSAVELAGDPTPLAAASVGSPQIGHLRMLCDRHLGVRRDARGLATFVDHLHRTRSRAGGVEAGLVAWLIADAALRRNESRGSHFRIDAPEPRDEWLRRLVVDRNGWRAIRSRDP
jgi:L-aspartate oxidase